MLTKYFRLLFVTTLVVVIGLLIVQTGFAMQVQDLNATLTCTGMSWDAYTLIMNRDNTGQGRESATVTITDGAGTVLYLLPIELPLDTYPVPANSDTNNQGATPQDNERILTLLSLEGNGFLEEIVYTTTNPDCTGGSTPPTPVSNFTFTTDDLTASFFDDSSVNPTSWEWDFGDGNTSTDQNPVHTYAAADTYTVCLIASNVNGQGTQACQDVTVTEPVPTPTPVSNFTFTTNDLTASFFDDSSENPTSWEWDFGDG